MSPSSHEGSLPSGLRRALVIVPTINEAGAIEEVIERLFPAVPEGVELLVVDDASGDGTPEIVQKLADRHPVHLIERPGKLGLGTAYVTGFTWGLENGFDAIVEMDGDLSHDPAQVPDLLGGLAQADLVVGSRYVKGGEIRNWGRFRRWLSAAGNLYARRWALVPVMDSTSGFRAYRAEALSAIRYETVGAEGYAFQIELTRRAHLAGCRIAEIPITFVERTSGSSKMSRRIVLEALMKVTGWGASQRLHRILPRRRRVTTEVRPTDTSRRQ